MAIIDVAPIVIPIVLDIVVPEIAIPVQVAEDIVVTARVARGGNWIIRLIRRISGQCCFTAGTLVDTSTGLRQIETIKFGDLVFSRDEATGLTALKAVTAVTPAHDEPIVALTLETPWGGDAKPERIETTATHPWRSTKGRWIVTADLHPGDLIVRETGLPARVVAEAVTGETKATYNLTIADYHTYFVGKDKVWVHNVCGPLSPNQMNKAVERGQAPPGIGRTDTGKIPGEEQHTHIDGEGAINIDGTWKHGDGNLTNAQADWLRGNGYRIPE